jgi:hypothetical protein
VAQKAINFVAFGVDESIENQGLDLSGYGKDDLTPFAHKYYSN